ncbi:hypothetical protein BpHYR1_043386 [Brachionus plicatilis]|uniref:Uncharacterized protein n=1 Tax=Brachionus plicatilis TaxID=10195 RepID=A0A3M7QW17_BRAPC|nr:hypothetical protein BpHYR1_043386 [Brachionus plicatilis]
MSLKDNKSPFYLTKKLIQSHWQIERKNKFLKSNYLICHVNGPLSFNDDFLKFDVPKRSKLSFNLEV